MNDVVTENRRQVRFSGHQTFAFRYGWLEKGVRAIERSQTIFSDVDAIVHLGVGKNMVESIRHWCLVTQMLEEGPTGKQSNRRVLHVTLLARKLLLNDAWDPFFEDDASLWLIHWLLVSNPFIITTWQLMFSYYQRPDASKYEIVDYIMTYARKHNIDINENSLSRDVDCFLRTYLPVRTGHRKAVDELVFHCPLQELNLLYSSPDGEIFRFAIGSKPTLPAKVFGFALAQYFDRTSTGRNTLSVQDCLYGSGSPGQAFKLDENSLIEYIEEIERVTRGKFALDETAGLKQVYRRQTFEPLRLLESYYAQKESK